VAVQEDVEQVPQMSIATAEGESSDNSLTNWQSVSDILIETKGRIQKAIDSIHDGRSA
jgi:hypothetical protein